MCHIRTLLVTSLLVACIYSSPAPQAVPDKASLSNAFSDPKTVEKMIDCFVDRSNNKCSNQQMNIKVRAREMMRNQGRCSTCTPEELASMEHSMELLQSQYPLLFTRMVFAMLGDGVADTFSSLISG
ncbi:unnamed protein product [Meganyctiphanes norvegica]|uniref:Uncharacterized protein n=1 Tax=Meganyctiphanes norvegica TaxID=48144 RepID=A0AAV2PNW3_MEGNR